MMPSPGPVLPQGEIAVIGLGRSGRAAAELLLRAGAKVYVSDASRSETLEPIAASLRAQGGSVDIGTHDLERIASSALVVVSPGVPPTAAPLVAAAARHVPVVAEVEIALRFLQRTRYIAVTGTNGKTTTTALIGHLLRSLGVYAVDAGNIGTPVAEIAVRDPQPEWLALEMSSFQLHDTPSLAPAVGVLTNLAPDHLDRYSDAEAYYADKARLFANATDDSQWVLNADDDRVMAMSAGVPGARWLFSLHAPTAARRGLAGVRDMWFDESGGVLRLGETAVARRDAITLLGNHNVANAMAACLAVTAALRSANVADLQRRLAQGLESFTALPHRLQVIGEYGGVQWIDDSKATNVSSTLVAVQGMTRPYVLLLGGRHKGEPYRALAEPFRRHGKALIAYGESAPIIETDLGGLVRVERMDSDFDAVIRRAKALTSAGDAVLLSPACSSYDMFRNYEHRGEEFARLAAKVVGA